MTSEKQSGSEEVIEMMTIIAGTLLANNDYEKAVDMYRSILKLHPNETAQYNLATLYAQGKGVKQDFKEAAYWFNQVATSFEDERAKKLCLKCMVDFIHRDFESKTPEEIYIDMIRFVKAVWPEKNLESEVNENLFAMAGNHFNKKEYPQAAKLFRAAAEFGNDGKSQNYLAILYNAGLDDFEQNDLVGLYWFDRASDNGIEAAKIDRDGILHAYYENLSLQDFYEQMMLLSGWCSLGNSDIPKDAYKAVYWRETGEKMAVEKNKSMSK